MGTDRKSERNFCVRSVLLTRCPARRSTSSARPARERSATCWRSLCTTNWPLPACTCPSSALSRRASSRRAIRRCNIPLVNWTNSLLRICRTSAPLPPAKGATFAGCFMPVDAAQVRHAAGMTVGPASLALPYRVKRDDLWAPPCKIMPTRKQSNGWRRSRYARLFLQILVNDLDEFFGGQYLRRITACAWTYHMLANVVLDNLRDEAVHCPPARSGLLQHRGTLTVCFDRALHGFYLAANALETIE